MRNDEVIKLLLFIKASTLIILCNDYSNYLEICSSTLYGNQMTQRSQMTLLSHKIAITDMDMWYIGILETFHCCVSIILHL